MTTSPLPETRTDSGFATEWRRVRLAEVCSKATLIDPASTPDREYEYVDVSSVSSDMLKITGTTKVKGTAAPSRARKLLQADDVIFATVRPTLRRVALVPPILEGQLASTAFCVIRVNRELADPAFLYYTLITNEFVGSVGILQRGASYPAVTDSDVLNSEILLPRLPEQRAIAGVLSKLQNRVEVQDRIVARLKELNAATMAKLFRGGLRGEPLKQTEIGQIRSSWGSASVGAVTDPVSGGTPTKSRLEWWRGAIPWASPKDMKTPHLWDTKDHISQEGAEQGSTLVPAKTVFVVIRGMVLAKDVPVAIAEVPMAFNQDMRALQPTGAIDPDFLLYAIMARKTELTRSIGTSAHGTRRLGSSAVEELLIPMPGADEQRRIAGVLRKLDLAFGVARRRAAEFRVLFARTLELLVTGAVRIPGSLEDLVS